MIPIAGTLNEQCADGWIEWASLLGEVVRTLPTRFPDGALATLAAAEKQQAVLHCHNSGPETEIG